jgi:anti-anti-sigma regulatory factor
LHKIVRKEIAGNTIIDISGRLDETADFQKDVGTVMGEVHVFCRNTERVNSFGIRNWMRFFETLKRKGDVVKFFECSAALVRIMNLFYNFPCGGEVISICLPYYCRTCEIEYDAIVNVRDLKTSDYTIPDRVCKTCGGRVEFDEQSRDYFEFFMNS